MWRLQWTRNQNIATPAANTRQRENPVNEADNTVITVLDSVSESIWEQMKTYNKKKQNKTSQQVLISLIAHK